MKPTSIYQFTLVLDGVNESTPGLEDSLYESHCDDALINFRNGTVYLDFDREAACLEDALITAINSVESALTTCTVVSVAPDDFVSESEIAKRLDVKRQTVSLWVKGLRRYKTIFPTPVLKLSEKSPLWRWSEITEWLCEQNKIDDSQIVENAKLIANMNLALNTRNHHNMRQLNRLRKKLQLNNKNAA